MRKCLSRITRHIVLPCLITMDTGGDTFTRYTYFYLKSTVLMVCEMSLYVTLIITKRYRCCIDEYPKLEFDHYGSSFTGISMSIVMKRRKKFLS